MEVFITLKTTGIIVEYNPLHPGHIYHMEQARKQTGADYLIAVMSGSFVQRGAPALLDKYTRTRMALLAGADVVIELPVCFATGSAGDFAAGAVSLLDKLGCVDGLCFGSESGDISLFEKTATLLQCESAAFSNALKKALKSGLSFPAARQQALLLCLDMAKDMPSTACPDNNSTAEQIVALLSSPNNLLGLEYTLALLRRNSSIRPFTISRVGSGYHDPLGGAAPCAGTWHPYVGEPVGDQLRAAGPARFHRQRAGQVRAGAARADGGGDRERDAGAKARGAGQHRRDPPDGRQSLDRRLRHRLLQP